MPTQRLGRAALVAFGIGALAAGSVACSDEPDVPEDEDTPPDAGASAKADAASGNGSSTGKDAGGDAAKDAGGGASRLDSGSVVALYGLALPDSGFGGGQPGGAFVPDAGTKLDDAGADASARDAGRKDSGPGGDLGGSVALYGLAPAPPDKTSDAATEAGRGGDLGGIVPLYGLAVGATDNSAG